MIRNRSNPALDLPLDQIDFERVLDASIRLEVATAEFGIACRRPRPMGQDRRVAIAGEFQAAAISALNSNWADYLRGGRYARDIAAIDARRAALLQVAA